MADAGRNSEAANALGSTFTKSGKEDLCRISKQSTIFGKSYDILSGMNQATKRIVLAFRLAGEPGRRKLDGFFRYMADHQLDWQLQFVRIREDFNAEFVRSFAERGID